MKKKTNDGFNVNMILVAILLFIIVLLLVALILVLNKNNKTTTNNTNPSNSVDTNVVKDDSTIDNTNDNTKDEVKVNDDNYISREKVISIVSNDIGISQNDMHDLDIELDYKYGKKVYEISFDYQYHEYEYYIDASNGDIVHSFKERD